MSIRRPAVLLAGAMALALSGAASALTPNPATLMAVTPTEAISSIDAFRAEVERIQENMRPGGAYMEISRQDRAEVERNLELIEGELERAGTIEAMSADSRVRVFNAQETVNGILTKAAEDSRLRCERRGRVGSNMRTTHCETWAERKRRAERDRQEVHQLMRFRWPDDPAGL